MRPPPVDIRNPMMLSLIVKMEMVIKLQPFGIQRMEEVAGHHKRMKKLQVVRGFIKLGIKVDPVIAVAEATLG